MLNIHNYDVYVFDLDGTLVDSVPDLSLALNESLEHFNLPKVEEAIVRTWVGNGSLKLVQRALEHVVNQGVSVEELHKQFLLNYKKYLCVKSTLYPEVEGLLADLKALDKTLVLLTNKPIQFVPELLKKLGVFDAFSLILGGDSLSEKKPHPMPLLHVLEFCSVSAGRCLMIGDSRSDIVCAQNANVDSVALMQGYHQGLNLSDLNPSYLFDDIAQFYTALTASKK